MPVGAGTELWGGGGGLRDVRCCNDDNRIAIACSFTSSQGNKKVHFISSKVCCKYKTYVMIFLTKNLCTYEQFRKKIIMCTHCMVIVKHKKIFFQSILWEYGGAWHLYSVHFSATMIVWLIVWCCFQFCVFWSQRSMFNLYFTT